MVDGAKRFAHWLLRARAEDWSFTVLIAALAALPRLYAALHWAREPVWDAHYYHYGAQRIAQGLGYSEDVLIGGALQWRPWCHYPVGYSALLGGVYRIFGSGPHVAPLLNVVLGVLTVMAAHRLARLFLSGARSRWAAVLTAIHPGLIAYSAVAMTEPLAALSVLWIGLAAFSCSKRVQGPLSGVLTGLAALVRPPALLLLPALLLARSRPYLQAIKQTAIAGAFALLMIAPWTVRNCQVMDGCALISTNGGWNLAIGALTPNGRFHTLRAEDGCKVVTGQVQQDRCWARVGLDVIANDPWAWLRKIPAKLEQTFNHESFAMAYLHEADPGTWSEADTANGRIVLTTFHHLLMIVATLGLVAFPAFGRDRASRVQLALLLAVLGFAGHGVLADEHPLYWLAVAIPAVGLLPLPGSADRSPPERFLLLTIATTALTAALFFGEDRYHLLVSPVLCLLAAGALRQPAHA